MPYVKCGVRFVMKNKNAGTSRKVQENMKEVSEVREAKKFISIIVVLSMLFCANIPIFAQGAESAGSAENAEYVFDIELDVGGSTPKSLKVGDVVNFKVYFTHNGEDPNEEFFHIWGIDYTMELGSGFQYNNDITGLSLITDDGGTFRYLAPSLLKFQYGKSIYSLQKTETVYMDLKQIGIDIYPENGRTELYSFSCNVTSTDSLEVSSLYAKVYKGTDVIVVNGEKQFKDQYTLENGNVAANSYDFSVKKADDQGNKDTDKKTDDQGNKDTNKKTDDQGNTDQNKDQGNQDNQDNQDNQNGEDNQNIQKPSLNKADHKAYLSGYDSDGDGTAELVKPLGLITRAEVATMLYRLLDDNSVAKYKTTSNKFSDVPASAWYCEAVSTLCNAGVISGYQDGTFRPNGKITRAEVAKMLYCLLDDETIAASSSASNKFSDVNSAWWYYNYVTTLSNAKIINGYTDGTFKPNGQIKRAETVSMINKLLGRGGITASGMLSNMKKFSDNSDTAQWYYAAVQEAANGHTYSIDGTAERWVALS